MTITMLHGDCTELLPTLPPASAQCIVTSPPYFGLRRYTDDPREIGNEPTPAEYVAHLVAVFDAAWRVLADDGTLWLNLGDSYGRGARVKWAGDSTRGTNAHKQVTDAGGYGSPTAILPDKHLLGIPWRVAFALQDAGWVLRNDIIWHKPSIMPEQVSDRFTRDHEYLFLFAKQPHYYFDAASVAEPAAESTKARAHLGARAISERQRSMQDLGMHGESNTLRVYDRETRNRRTVWKIASQPLRDAHFAAFPEKLVEPCILAGSRPGDTVLDMFAGSGTTLRVAERLQRNSIGIDLNGDYLKIQERRTNGVQVELFV